ncbi:XkdX family protein [Bacillus sp. 2205SS5-2]|uniref:XkdX family protein n=1 Tax=Bacillus sp. 2205SS5-2 TaxID=3109031 RepID=UPI0030043A8D
MQQTLSIDYFATVKRYYDKLIYSRGDVALFVQYNKISVAEYEQITGEEYGGGN